MLMWAIRLLTAILGLVVISGGYIAYTISGVPSQAVHYHANFLVVQDGKLVDYSENKYMEFEPCELDDHAGFFDPEERTHLHDNIGTVAHVHAPGVKWKELFTILGVNSDSASYVLNGKRVDGVQNMEMQSEDKLLVILGTPPPNIDEIVAHIPTTAREYNDGTKGVESCGSSEGGSYTLWQRLRIAFGI